MLPLDRIARGPGTEVLRWDPEGNSDGIVESVLSMLCRAAPGTGEPLVWAGLRGYSVRLRRAALGVLTTWFGDDLPGEFVDRVAAAAAVEPDDDLRAHLSAAARSGNGRA